MSQKIRIKRGLKSNLPTLDEGEMGFTTDSKEIFIGTQSGNIKTNISTLEDLTDVDIAEKANGHVLTYNATNQKFESKSLPSGIGGGDTIVISNLSNGEVVELDTSIKPANVTGLTAININKTALTLKWNLSESSNTQQYKIYQDGVLIKTNSYIERSANITNLNIYTSYTFKVTSVDDIGNESLGTEIIAKTLGYRLKMNGFSGTYLKTPSFTYNEVIMTFKTEKILGKYYIDARSALSNSHVFTDSVTESDLMGSYYNKAYINGIETPTTGSWIPDKIDFELRLLKTSAGSTGTTNIFSHYSGANLAVGEITRVVFINNGTTVADYDFRTGTYADQSGNGYTLTYTAGQFI